MDVSTLARHRACGGRGLKAINLGSFSFFPSEGLLFEACYFDIKDFLLIFILYWDIDN